MNLLRQSSTPGNFLAAVQDTLEPPGITSPVFKMPSFSRDESTSNITSEGDNGNKKILLTSLALLDSEFSQP